MQNSIWIAAGSLVIALGLGLWLWQTRAPLRLTAQELDKAWSVPLAPPDGALATYHLGHSLVGRDMPALLAQMAGHGHNSQLGWGASLMNHWQNDVPGFAEENHAPQFRPAPEALASGEFGVLVLTEMVELRDAIRYHDSGRHLAEWTRLARQANPGIRVYLYETWHRLDDPDGWQARIAADLPRLWQGRLMAEAMAQDGVGVIHLIPGGQVLSRAVTEAEAGRIPGLTRRQDFFALNPDGSPDTIHFNAVGAYLMALTHFAVIYQKDPAGLPHVQPQHLRLANGRALDLPAPTAQALQALVWPVVRSYAASGIKAD